MDTQPSGAIRIECYVSFCYFKLGLNELSQRFTADKVDKWNKIL